MKPRIEWTPALKSFSPGYCPLKYCTKSLSTLGVVGELCTKDFASWNVRLLSVSPWLGRCISCPVRWMMQTVLGQRELFCIVHLSPGRASPLFMRVLRPGILSHAHSLLLKIEKMHHKLLEIGRSQYYSHIQTESSWCYKAMLPTKKPLRGKCKRCPCWRHQLNSKQSIVDHTRRNLHYVLLLAVLNLQWAG